MHTTINTAQTEIILYQWAPLLQEEREEKRGRREDAEGWNEEGIGGLTEDPSIVDKDMYGTERFDGLFHDGFTFGHASWCGDRLTSGYKEGRRA